MAALDRALNHGETANFSYEIAMGVNRRSFEARVASVSPDEALFIIRDVTEQKRSAERTSMLELRLKQAERLESVGRLAGGIAHDFNNMLTVILGHLELVKSRMAPSDPLQRELVEMEKAATRSKDVARQMLGFSRQQIIAPIVLDFNGRFAATQPFVSRLIGENAIVDFAPSADLWPVKCDPAQVDQIILNLVLNARDAMPDGGSIRIETYNRRLDEADCRNIAGAAPGSYAVLSVSDRGTGIPADMLPHIFAPFFTTKQVGQGTGLGLSMAYGIVKQNGGFIQVDSEPGRGSVFAVHLPRSVEAVREPELPVVQTPITGSETILLLEDDEMVRSLAKDLLESLGYEVMVAVSPADAVALSADPALAPDLLLTDMVMPGMSGIEVRDRVTALLPGIRTLFMSGYTTEAIVQEGAAPGSAHFIQKPFTLNELSRKVRDALGPPPAD